MMKRASDVSRLLRSARRSICLLALLIAATLDAKLRRPRAGAEGAVWIHHWCRRFVKAIGLVYTVEGTLPKGGVVVSNHLSYLDILLYSAITPCVMVAKHEVRGWPLIGWLTAQAGTVYVQRSEDVRPGETRQSHAEVNALMATAYASGLPVLFFPEGTTTVGGAPLPFRRGLFHSVLHCGVALRVAALGFELAEDNGHATVANDVCFVGDALFVPHLFACLGLRGLRARVQFGEEVTTRTDRFTLANGSRAAIATMSAAMHAELEFAAPAEESQCDGVLREGLTA